VHVASRSVATAARTSARRGTRTRRATVQIDKQQILEFLRNRGDQQQADQAASELPDQVDTDQHGDLLGKFGINPQELMSGGIGGIGDKLGF
jgi:hypothetical protein